MSIPCSSADPSTGRATGSTAADRRRKNRSRPLALLVTAILAILQVPASAQDRTDSVATVPEWMQSAEDLLQAGRWEEAGARLEELTRSHPQDARVWVRLAFVELQRGQSDAALQAAQKAHAIDSTDLDTILILSQVQAQLGNGAGALSVLEEGLAAHPQERQLLELMTTLSLSLREWPKAAGLLRQLIHLYPEVPSYRLDLGRLLLNTGELEDAVGAFRAASERGADPGLCLAMEGKARLAGGDERAALDAFRRSNEFGANSSALGGEATVHYLRGERGEAIRKFRQAIELDPEDADLHYNLGNVLVQTERFEEAEESYRTSLRLDGQSASAHLNLAVLLLNRFAVSEAEQHLRWATQLDPNLPKPYLHLGRIAGSMYDYAAAIQAYTRYRELLPDPAESERIATVIVELGRLEEESRAARERGEIHLLQLKVSTADQARSVIERVHRGEDFYVLAEQESELADVAGVDTGFLDPASVSEPFREAVTALSRGEMTAPIRTQSGFFVFRRVE